MGLVLGCFDAAAAGRKVSPDARQSREGPEANYNEKERVRGKKAEEKVQDGDEAKHAVKAARKEKGGPDAIVMRHQFPFHSRPGLL